MQCHEEYAVNRMCSRGHKLFDDWYDESWANQQIEDALK